MTPEAIYFRDGGPRAGGAFEFFEGADVAIVDFLQEATSASGFAENLVEFLHEAVKTYCPHEMPPLSTEGQYLGRAGHPAVYVLTSEIGEATFESASLGLRLLTELWTFVEDSDARVAIRDALAISGAMASLLGQSSYMGSSHLWVTHFWNAYPEAITQITQERVLMQDTFAGVRLTLPWHHQETME